MSLLDAKPIYKPFHYPWAYDAWLKQQRIHWMPEEVPLGEDCKDWRNKLTDSERNLLTQIFRFFTQADVEVNNCYMEHYSRVFKPTEVQMMLAAFSRHGDDPHRRLQPPARHDRHAGDRVLGLPRRQGDEGQVRLHAGVRRRVEADIASTLAMFGAFTEGLQLFASFAMLMNFPRFNKMKGMGQIVSLVGARRDAALRTRSSSCSTPSCRRTGDLDRGAAARDLSSPARPSSTTRTPSSTSPSSWAASRA